MLPEYIEYTKYIEFISKELISKLWNKYTETKKRKHQQLTGLSDLFGPLDSLVKYYVEPYCQNINPANYDEEEPITIVKTPIFSFINDFFNREFKITDDGRNQLFVLSDSGVGKTSLLIMIKLCELLPKISNDINIKDNYKIEIMRIDSQLATNVHNLADISNTILLLDAFDEDLQSTNNPSKRLSKILQLTSKFKRVIITCRTQLFPDKGITRIGEAEKISIGGYECPLIYLSLFDERQVLSYLDRLYPEKNNKSGLVRKGKAITILNQANTLSFRPFLLAHIDDLLENQIDIWNEYTILDELVKIWLRREVRKISSPNVNTELLWVSCIVIALRMQMKGKRTILKKEFESSLQEMPVLSYLEHMNYGTKSLLNRNSAGEYRFSHYSIQEFLIANYIIQNSREDLSESVKHYFSTMPISRSEVILTTKILELISLGLHPEWNSKYPYQFDNLDLSGLKFPQISYENCGFSNCNLRETNWTNYDLQGVDFTDVDLSYSTLDNAHLEKTIFSRTKLENTSMQNVHADHAIFSNLNLRYTNLKNATEIKLPNKGISYYYVIMPNGKIKRNDQDK